MFAVTGVINKTNNRLAAWVVVSIILLLYWQNIASKITGALKWAYRFKSIQWAISPVTHRVFVHCPGRVTLWGFILVPSVRC